MHKATTFEHGGKVYEVRAIPTLNGWKVRIFVEGIPANGFTYSVDSEIYQDAAMDGVPEDLVAGLMETAERDFRRGSACMSSMNLRQGLAAGPPWPSSRRKILDELVDQRRDLFLAAFAQQDQQQVGLAQLPPSPAQQLQGRRDGEPERTRKGRQTFRVLDVDDLLCVPKIRFDVDAASGRRKLAS